MLTELKDKIHCVTDQVMEKAGKYDPSGYFLIEVRTNLFHFSHLLMADLVQLFFCDLTRCYFACLGYLSQRFKEPQGSRLQQTYTKLAMELKR